MAQGFLAIWSDVDRSDETDYLHWLTREHVQERLSIPGFLAVRVFRAEAESRGRYLIFYRLRDASVVGSEAYLERLNSPTAWSQRIMPTLKNFIRGGGRILHERGEGAGGYAAPVLFSASQVSNYLAAAEEIAKADRMAATRIFEVDGKASGIATSEKSMRAGDSSFEAMLLLESLDPGVLASGLEVMDAEDRSIYRQIFAFGRE